MDLVVDLFNTKKSPKNKKKAKNIVMIDPVSLQPLKSKSSSKPVSKSSSKPVSKSSSRVSKTERPVRAQFTGPMIVPHGVIPSQYPDDYSPSKNFKPWPKKRPLQCQSGYEFNDKGNCVKKCVPPKVRNPATGRCRNPIIGKPVTRKLLIRGDPSDPDIVPPKFFANICDEGYELNDKGKCVKKCVPPQVRNPATGRCKKPAGVAQIQAIWDNPAVIPSRSSPVANPVANPVVNGCLPGYEFNDKGKCVKKCVPPQVRNPATGRCKKPAGVVLNTPKTSPTPKPLPICLSGFELNAKGKCVKKCVPPQVRNPATGRCKKPV